MRESGGDVRGFYHEDSLQWFKMMHFVTKEGELHGPVFVHEFEEFLDFKFYVQQCEDPWAENTLFGMAEDFRSALAKYRALVKVLRLRPRDETKQESGK